MPRGSWTTYLEPAWLREYREGVFVVEAQGEYAREWLESRLTSTLERVLGGMCGRRVGVRMESGGKNPEEGAGNGVTLPRDKRL